MVITRRVHHVLESYVHFHGQVAVDLQCEVLEIHAFDRGVDDCVVPDEEARVIVAGYFARDNGEASSELVVDVRKIFTRDELAFHCSGREDKGHFDDRK